MILAQQAGVLSMLNQAVLHISQHSTVKSPASLASDIGGELESKDEAQSTHELRIVAQSRSNDARGRQATANTIFIDRILETLGNQRPRAGNSSVNNNRAWTESFEQVRDTNPDVV